VAFTIRLQGSASLVDGAKAKWALSRDGTLPVSEGDATLQGGQAVVNIYESENSALTQWKYRGVLFQIPDPQARTAECPNFFRIGDHWVLLVSPYGKVQYYAGSFDVETCRFQADSHGLVDCGPNFYAPNTMQLPDGRRIMWGWVNGFPGGRGWNGCLSLPRVLSLSNDGQLRQSPAPQLRKLRGRVVAWRNTVLQGDGVVFRLPHTNTLEIHAEILLRTSENVVVSLKNAAAGSAPERTARWIWTGCHRTSREARADMNASSASSSDAVRSSIGHDIRSAHCRASSKAPSSSASLKVTALFLSAVSGRLPLISIAIVQDLRCRGLVLATCVGTGSLTAVSQTGGTAPDSGVLCGHPVDPDLRKRTRQHWPDVLYATTDQKVGGSSPSERARQTQVRAILSAREVAQIHA